MRFNVVVILKLLHVNNLKTCCYVRISLMSNICITHILNNVHFINLNT